LSFISPDIASAATAIFTSQIMNTYNERQAARQATPQPTPQPSSSRNIPPLPANPTDFPVSQGIF
jgi:hypothetical protein